MDDDRLTEKIIACAFKVHNTLGPGFSEKVYENATRIELTKQGVDVKQQVPIKVNYKGEVEVRRKFRQYVMPQLPGCSRI